MKSNNTLKIGELYKNVYNTDVAFTPYSIQDLGPTLSLYGAWFNIAHKRTLFIDFDTIVITKADLGNWQPYDH